MDKTTLAELTAHLAEVETAVKEMAAQYADRDFTEEAQEKWDALKAEVTETKDRITSRQRREEELKAIVDAGSADKVEIEPAFSFQTRKRSLVPDDPTDLAEYRARARNLDELNQAHRDGAKYLIENRYDPKTPGVNREDAQADAERLADFDEEVALRFIVTSRKEYNREFGDYLRTGVAGPELQRAASLTTTAGGFAVPVELDTTLLLTNAGVISPIRSLARVRQTNVNTYEFITSTGITAAYGAEATEASDNAPVLAQPTLNVEKAFAFVPMSIEVASDWANIQADLAMAFADAKEQLESSKFLTGVGHGSNEPMGLIAAGAATAIVTSATTAVVALADLYSLELALSPRYRARASIVGNKAVFQKVRGFGTASGPSAWTDSLRDGNPNQLLGYPAYEWSSYSSGVTTSGSTVLTIGDFSYFGIVDRVGMNVEFIPHLFGSGSRFPTGQRGLYMWWRTSSKLLSPSLGANSAFVSLKVL
jgi:HK97 family phage major capsid protein